MNNVLFVLKSLLYGWILGLIQLIALLARLLRGLGGRREQSSPNRDDRANRSPCISIDRPEFVRPDPLIYDQYYLMSLGLAVTWDNPDIQLYLGGKPVSSESLEKNTTYEIRARVWNGSLSAPVLDMPVHFSYLEFGIGTVSHALGTNKVKVLGVKGGPNHPAFVSFSWKTPDVDGHYCLQVVLDPADDSNKFNNLGQENTTVGHAHSPAAFTFKLRNATHRQHTYRFEVDAYTTGVPVPCDERQGAESATRLKRHRHGTHPVPPGWTVVIDPPSPTLAPGAEITITARVTPPASFTGTQKLNVNAFHSDGLAGGVTLTVVAGS